jgi:23S rRNA (guanosine2251-2'-O)-methyltransferase
VEELLYGRSAVYEALRSHRRQLGTLQIAQGTHEAGRLADIVGLAGERKLHIVRAPRIKVEPRGVNHQGVALEVGAYPYCDLADILDKAQAADEPPFVLLLDALQDPQNFGTLLRTAEITGIHGVIIPLAHSAEVSPAVVNASAGATEHLLIARSNLAQAIDALRAEDIWVVGLDQHGAPLASSQRHLVGSLALIVGSEGEGLRELTRKKCDILLRLPMRGRIDSLNAAVAGSIALYMAYMARPQVSENRSV